MKRRPTTCNGCKALILDGTSGTKCWLGYQQTADGAPKEICPKPKTNLEMATAQKKWESS